jgi:hypothetical protein
MGAQVFLVLLAIYCAGYAGRTYSADDISSLSVGWSIAHRGDLEARIDAWTARFPDQSNTFGPAGQVYSKKGPLLAFLAALVYRITSGTGLPAIPIIAALNLVVTALTGWLLFHLTRLAGFGPRPAALTALVWGLFTPALAYSRFLFTEPLAALGLVVTYLASLRFPGWMGGLGAGLGLSFAALARPAALALVPALLPLVGARKPGRLVGFGLGLLPGGVGLGLYNAVRFGDPLQSGLSPIETFSTPLWVGIPGLLWSPGRGLLFFAPAVLVGLAGFPLIWRAHRRLAVTSGLIVLGHLILYGAWYGWDGGHAWGPRFLVPALPFLALGMGPLLERWAGRGPAFKSATVAVLALSLLVQGAGFLTDFNRLPQPARPGDPMLWEFLNPVWTVTFQLLTQGQLDPVWARHGLWPIPVLLGAAVALALLPRPANFRQKRLAAGLALTLTALGFQVDVASLETDPRGLELAAALNALRNQVRMQDAVVVVAPYAQTWFLNQYRLPNPVLGLTEDSIRLEPRFRLTLSRLLKPGAQLWLLVQGFAFPDPAAELDAELHRELCWTGPVNSFGGVRLTRFLVPRNFQDLETQATFGRSLRLKASAWDGGRILAPGDRFCVRLEWEVIPGVTDSRVSVQVIDAAGRLVAQHDGPPGAGFKQPGPTIIDNHGLSLPGNLTGGTFYLTVVVYSPDTLERYTLADGTDRLTLAAFRVERPAR